MRTGTMTMTGALAAALYCAGDVLLFGGAGDPDDYTVTRRPGNDRNISWVFPHSQRRLQAGALAGVIGAPFWFVGTAGQDASLRAGRPSAPWVTAATMLSGVGHSIAAFIHASFYPYGEAYQVAEAMHADDARDRDIERVVHHAHGVGATITTAYAIYGVAQAASSVLAGAEILRGRTVYPRWAAVVAVPLVPVVIAIAATSVPAFQRSTLRPFRGAGLSIGWMVSYLAGGLIGRRGRAGITPTVSGARPRRRGLLG